VSLRHRHKENKLAYKLHSKKAHLRMKLRFRCFAVWKAGFEDKRGLKTINPVIGKGREVAFNV
jgi:hypothetical protein